MSLDTDIVIVGAGVSGLSLACQMVDRRVARRIVLVDPRERYDNDRTFCFWNVVPHPFEGLVSHRWARWRVRGDGGWVERGAPGLAYQHLPAAAFYERALGRLRASPAVELKLGTRAGAVREERDHVAITLGDTVVRARCLFDSRPIQPSKGREVVLLQAFEGWHVRAEGRAPFDTGVATLMDFRASQEHGIHFVYVLPYSPEEALVEATWFARAVPDEAYQPSLERYLRDELGLTRWTVLRRERGVIPMSTEPMPIRVGRRRYRIGLAGGMAKPSTGYAFLAIQQFSAAMAARLAEDELPAPPEPRTARARTLDRVFLSYLSRYPERAPATFASLFERVDPALLVRFLSDRAGVAETLTVMSALPFAPFTLETLRSARLWARAR